MNKKRLVGVGILVAIIGILGRFLAEDYLQKHPGRGILGTVLGKLGSDVPWQTQLALFFNEYGFILAGVGAALFLVGFVTKR
ncbi:hypothetical protein V6C53_04280 [Desulfocurvibacter africanus]|uniref:Uncharacterized protein n=1 Tax=Desulfocurvibacter africanus subsp. africanus str. Walvis Bay TaxID=690850 RepID=F3YZX3_DESAF|nr:hypothetical protein [Desulfocurvibacter africanus]EGJ50928.1 hypothetical protein Desaf_2609 [Desulfocurvibacter africanus subsp. africanus str. Walvis Bay]